MPKRKPTDHRLEVAKQMPPLKRRESSKSPYDLHADQVLAWMGKNLQLQGYLFDLLNRIGYVKYDQQTGIWSGVDYED